jgi:hypothetical protein
LDWLATHPGSQDVCQIQIKNNAANSAPIGILSKTAGVVAYVGQGVGIGRIVDVLLFDTTLSQ